ncbi:NAD(P)/FAD-dependent oxidoreductase [Calidithermus roseus]|uniref:NADH:ubiquinone reductase (non-electrogenic) n=1 Tax=Calidithermus roseus TaxID=1644118 RepID=A0A399F3C4_9DEIN|nr:NAD(P)/FAD-dependent oxidoreductase [Calidithermus roseus]RIH89111.1 NADH dehydrogenase [Calidithermus roseus]
MAEKHVVVLGAGFAGLNAVRELSREPSVRVTLVDRNNYHLFQPLLYQVASAGLEAPQIAFPVRAFLRRHKNARFLLGNAEGIDPRARVLMVEGRPVPYDYLIVGLGTRTNDFGLPGVAKYGYALKTLDDAMRIRDRLISAGEEASRTADPHRRRALLTMVIVGGGPTGVELAGALGEVRRHVIPRDFPGVDLREVRVILIETGSRLLDAFAPSSARYAQRFLERLGVEVWLGERVVEIRPDGVRLESGKFIPTFTAVWTAGVTGQGIPGLQVVRGNRVATTPELYVPEHPEVYVAGDMNFLEYKDGRPYPQVAPTAMQQGRLAAQNILRELRGEEKRAFRYFDKGNMATLGRNAAVAEIKGLRLSAFPAWVAWLGVHLYYLAGFRNRLMVLGNWAYSYFTYDYAVRVMHHRHEFPALKTPLEQPAEMGA